MLKLKDGYHKLTPEAFWGWSKPNEGGTGYPRLKFGYLFKKMIKDHEL
jgi:hypothetical protein